RRARPPRAPAPAGRRVLRPGDGQRRRPRHPRQPSGPAATPRRPPRQRRRHRAPLHVTPARRAVPSPRQRGEGAPTGRMRGKLFSKPPVSVSPPRDGNEYVLPAMLQLMRPAPRLIAAAALCLSAFAAHAAVVREVEIRGLDEAMTRNVELSLSLVQAK